MGSPEAKLRIDGRFEVEGEVARGGMARLLRARDLHTGKWVAIKLGLVNDADSADRFAREAAVLSELHHPGIVPYVAHGAMPNGERWLAMEWLEGIDLGERIKAARIAMCDAPTRVSDVRAIPSLDYGTNACLSVADALVLGMRIASGLGELHRRGFVHRDVKPGNIFLRGGSADDAVLVDFGTAKGARTGHDLTLGGVLVGTPSYMSPEQASSAPSIGSPTDVWALGCVLYYALTAHNPFEGGNLLAILARILIDEPLPLRTLRPDVPEPLAKLIARMLTKDPAARPRDGAAVVAELRNIEAPGSDRTPFSISTTTLGAREQRVRSLVVGRATGSTKFDALRDAVARTGATLHNVADGSLVVAITPEGSSTDQARRAASAALALRGLDPSLRLAIASARMEATSAEPSGEVVDRAVGGLENAQPGETRVDTLTAALVDLHFVVANNVLEGARDIDAGRTLLGKPTPWVGRKRELTTLRATWDECVDEPRARAAIVLGEPGIGKSRLRRELTHAIKEASEDVRVLFGAADSLGAGSPFAMTAPVVRSAAGIADADDLETRQRKLRALAPSTQSAAFLGEMIATPFDDAEVPALAGARRDPITMHAAMTGAWVDWLAAETKKRPVLLVLEDLHWSDLVSVKLVDAALQRLANAPLFVLALARPEVTTTFPQLWSARGPQEIRLEGLSKKASRQLVLDVLGKETPEDVVDRIVERSGGNAFFLEELIRTIASGGEALPDTVIGIVQSRLDALGDEAKRVLRAASIFGEVFPADGVEELLGASGGPFRLREWIDDLVEREIIGHHTSGRRGDELVFRHALVRDAAYDMLPERDRETGHRAAAEWLERTGYAEPLLLAEQFVRGRLPQRAVRWFRRAAEQALDGRDLDAVCRHAQRAIDAGAEGTDLAVVHRLQAVAAYWQSRYADAQKHGSTAASLLTPGCAEWFRAVAETVVSSARLGDYATLDRFFDLAASTEAEPSAEAQQLVCLCRGTFQMIFATRFDASDAMLRRIESIATDPESLDPATRAQVFHVRGVRAAHAGDVPAFLALLEGATRAFEQAGDRNNLLLERTTIGWCYAELGDFLRAEALVRENLEACRSAGAQQAITYAKVNLGYILAYRPRLAEAKKILEEAIEECRAVGNTRLEGWATAHLAAVLSFSTQHDAALARATDAVRLLAGAPSLHGWALASRARALLALGDAEGAIGPAREAMHKLEALGGLLQGESLPPLVLRDALRAIGDGEGARRAGADAKARIEKRAARITDPDLRKLFLAIPENAQTLATA